jgi:alkylation response protein AidB-like acyl-CoA dehydrogenase
MTRTLETVPTIAVFPEERLSLSEKVEKWVWQLCRALEADYDRRYSNSSDPVTFRMESGRKYWKIMQNHGGVHAFIDKKTGEVYKPASWRGPAKGVRYDLRIIREREECLISADWAGGYLYMRG